MLPALMSSHSSQRFGRLIADVAIEWFGPWCPLLRMLPAFVNSQCTPGDEGLLTLRAQMGEALNMCLHMATEAKL